MGGWFWRAGDDCHLYSIDHLTESYFSSVGRNANLLLGMVIDDRGLVPDADQKQFADFGKRIKGIFSKPIGSISGCGEEYILMVPGDEAISLLVIQEDIKYGEKVRSYTIEVSKNNRWETICTGSSIGHKRIERVDIRRADKLRLKIESCSGKPLIKNFSAWELSNNDLKKM